MRNDVGNKASDNLEMNWVVQIFISDVDRMEEMKDFLRIRNGIVKWNEIPRIVNCHTEKCLKDFAQEM